MYSFTRLHMYYAHYHFLYSYIIADTLHVYISHTFLLAMLYPFPIVFSKNPFAILISLLPLLLTSTSLFIYGTCSDPSHLYGCIATKLEKRKSFTKFSGKQCTVKPPRYIVRTKALPFAISLRLSPCNEHHQCSTSARRRKTLYTCENLISLFHGLWSFWCALKNT